MAKRPSRRTLWILAAVVAVGLIVWRALAPASVTVSVATAESGPFEVTVDEDGRTRAVDRYVITAPVAGELERVPLRAGAPVEAGDIIARIQPPPLDERTRGQLRGALEAAQARARSAQATLQQAEAAAAQADRELERRRALVNAGAISAEQLEQFALVAKTRADEAATAREAAQAAAADVASARSALLGQSAGAAIVVRAPATGRIAAIPERSSRIVAPGEVIAEITDPSALEVVVDVLSADAVDIQPGMHATLTGWGGDEPLGASVRYIEPAAFTRISALGVEEQRVNVILDLYQRPESLGDGYRVEAAILVWQGEDVLTVPSSAVFRAGEGTGWRVFRMVDGRALLTEVAVAQSNGARTRVTNGLSPGDTVVLFPPDELEDGMRLSVER